MNCYWKIPWEWMQTWGHTIIDFGGVGYCLWSCGILYLPCIFPPVKNLRITFWKIQDPIINCFTIQIFTPGYEWNHNQIGNHFISQYKNLSPTLQITFLLKFSLSFFSKKIKNKPKSLREERRKREKLSSFFSIYIFSGVVFGQFFIVSTPINCSPKSLICWIRLGHQY